MQWLHLPVHNIIIPLVHTLCPCKRRANSAFDCGWLVASSPDYIRILNETTATTAITHNRDCNNSGTDPYNKRWWWLWCSTLLLLLLNCHYYKFCETKVHRSSGRPFGCALIFMISPPMYVVVRTEWSCQGQGLCVCVPQRYTSPVSGIVVVVAVYVSFYGHG